MENPFLELHSFNPGRVHILRFDDWYRISDVTAKGARVVGSFVQKSDLTRNDKDTSRGAEKYDTIEVKDWADVRFFVLVEDETSVLAATQKEILTLKEANAGLAKEMKELSLKLSAEEGENVRLSAELESAREKLAAIPLDMHPGWTGPTAVESVDLPASEEAEMLF